MSKAVELLGALLLLQNIFCLTLRAVYICLYTFKGCAAVRRALTVVLLFAFFISSKVLCFLYLCFVLSCVACFYVVLFLAVDSAPSLHINRNTVAFLNSALHVMLRGKVICERQLTKMSIESVAVYFSVMYIPRIRKSHAKPQVG